MKSIGLKKLTSFCLVLAMLLAMVFGMSTTTALADDVILTPGPTVIADPNSPTGYTVHFVYVDAAATRMQLNVGMYKDYNNPTSKTTYTPFQYFPGCMRGGGTYTMDMTKVDDSHWVADVPLSGGSNQYSFMKNGSSTLLKDPANPPLWAPDGLKGSGGTDRPAFNKVNVPADPVKQNFAPTIEKARWENPRTGIDHGTWSYVPFTISGTTHYLGVYLPPNYDPNRAQPYKTVYLLHGMNQDQSDWMNIGSAPTIMDNLIAEGKTEPAIIVAPNQNYLGSSPYTSIENTIIPFVESNYNVSKDRMDRAWAGLSMGGGTTISIINNNPLRFGYYGIFNSYGALGTITKTTANLKKAYILIGTGCWDTTVTPPSATTINGLKGSLNFTFKSVAGAHDFHAWCQELTSFLKDYAFKQAAFENQAPLSVLTTQADKVQAGQTFDVPTSLFGPTNANTEQLNYAYDATKFEYVDFKPADGVTVLDTKISDGSASLTLMTPDYNAQKLGTLTLRAKADATLGNEWKTVDLTASCALKDASGNKSIVPINGSVSFTTIGVKGDTNADGKVDLIDLSNLIDWFGKTSADSQWHNQYTFFDYNNNGQIDISDISLVAQML